MLYAQSLAAVRATLQAQIDRRPYRHQNPTLLSWSPTPTRCVHLFLFLAVSDDTAAVCDDIRPSANGTDTFFTAPASIVALSITNNEVYSRSFDRRPCPTTPDEYHLQASSTMPFHKVRLARGGPADKYPRTIRTVQLCHWRCLNLK